MTLRRPRRLHDLADVVLDERVVARLERADVDDHVDLVGAARTASRASNALAVGVIAPSGKPTTAHTITPEPSR